MMSTKLAIVIAATCLLSAVSGAQTEFTHRVVDRSDPDMVQLHDISNPAPDYLMYRSFLRSLASYENEEEANHYVQDSLRLEHDEEGAAKAATLRADLDERGSVLAAEIDVATLDALCGDDRDRRSKEDVYQILDELRRTRDQIAERHYVKMLTEVANDTAVALTNELLDMKDSTVVVRRTHKSMWESNGPNDRVLAHVEIMCANALDRIGG